MSLVPLYTEPAPPRWIRVVAGVPAVWGLITFTASGPLTAGRAAAWGFEIVMWALAIWMFGVGPTDVAFDPERDELVTTWHWRGRPRVRRERGGFREVRTVRRARRSRTVWQVELVRADGSTAGLFPFRGTREQAATLAAEIAAKLTILGP